MRSRRIRIILGVAAVVVVVVGALAFVGWYQLFREVPQRITSEQQRFAYGSIGNESGEGLPFEVWRALPGLFPAYLPDWGRGGYPATRADFQGYIRFLVKAAADPRFTADNVMRAIERRTDLSAIDKLLYRYVI